jgi:hypothetical protein
LEKYLENILMFAGKFTRKLNLFLAGPRAAEAALGTQYQVNEVGNK